MVKKEKGANFYLYLIDLSKRYEYYSKRLELILDWSN